MSDFDRGFGIGGLGRHDPEGELTELIARGEMEIRERPATITEHREGQPAYISPDDWRTRGRAGWYPGATGPGHYIIQGEGDHLRYVPAAITRYWLRCRRCGTSGYSGDYPFSTMPGSGYCDDCCG